MAVLKPIDCKPPASDQQIVNEIQSALRTVYEREAVSVQISIHMKDGGYYTFESFPK